MRDLLFRNRRLLVLTVLLILATGGFALLSLPRQEDPTLTPRFGLVITRLPGASAERIESLVTDKIEHELREVEELKTIASTSVSGVSSISLEIDDTVTDVDGVWSRVRDRLEDARAEMPAGATPPELGEKEQTDTYTFMAGLRWDADAPPAYGVLRRLAEDLQDRMRDVPGTAFVKLFGAPHEEVRVELDREAMARLGLSAGEIAHRIESIDAKVAAGLVRTGGNDFTVEVTGELTSLQRIRDVPLTSGSGGQVVRLSDVGSVHKTITQPSRELVLLDGKPGISVAARMAVGQRTDVWAAAVRRALEPYGRDLPPAIVLETLFDQSVYVERRLGSLVDNFLLGVLFVMCVILLTMGWRSAIVVGVALPLATLMVLAGLNFLELPIQQMSITGLIIALGLLIDNAIIMVDEVSHRLHRGMERGAAIREAVGFLAVPLAGSTFTTALAFMPMVVVPGPMGEFIGTIGISVILAIASSLFLALTVLPSLIALLDRGGDERGGWLRTGISLGRLSGLYRGVVGFMVRHRTVAFAFALALPLLGFAKMSSLNEQFFPPADRDQLRIEMTLARQASIEQTYALAEDATEFLLADAAIDHVRWYVGRDAAKFYYNMLGGREGRANVTEAMVTLRPGEDAIAFVRRMQTTLDERYPQAQVLVRPLEQGPPFEAPIEMRIYGPDLGELDRLGKEARRILASVPDVTQTRMTLSLGRPRFEVRLDEASLRRTGLSNRDVALQVGAALEGAPGGSLIEATEELPVRVRLATRHRDHADGLAALDLIPAADVDGRRRPVPLTSVGRLDLVPEDGQITRRDGRRVNTVRGYTTAGVLPATVLAAYSTALEQAAFELPPGYRMEFGGEQAERNEAVAYLLGSVLILMILMVASLVLSFRSFRLTALLLTIAALSIGLGLFALFVFDQNFGFMAIVGTLGLVGVAVNDAIAVLAGIQADPVARTGDPQAITEVVVRSTRHVLSTTLTTIAGFLPLILAGGGFWPPLAIAIAGGVAGATVLALVFLPAGYRLLHGRRPASS